MRHALIALILILAIVPAPLYAVTDSFTISMEITGAADGDAPSVPANLSATAVATTQINLSWDASTDNVAVTGYQVFRDGTQIATSTGTSYSDTGLSPDTTYSYTVTAFDAALNISAASGSASATTFAAETGSIASGGYPIDLINLSVIPSNTSAIVRWETNPVSRATILWGTTRDYELGSVQEQILSTEHEVLIPNLVPSTTYYYTIRAVDGRSSYEHTLARNMFRTTDAPDLTAPANVSGLFAGINGDDIVLSWINPTDTDFSHVRVIRNDTFYPVDPNDGRLVYEGDESLIRDVGVVPDGSIKYYTVFSYDRNGNVSSGAVVHVIIDPDAVIDRGALEDLEQLLDFSDLIFRHGTVELPNDGEEVEISADRQLTVAIPYDTLLEHLKAVTVTLTDPEFPERTFTFLLKADEEKTEYRATLSSLQRAGVYDVEVSVLDFDLKSLTKVNGALLAEKAAAVLDRDEDIFGILGIVSRELFNRSRLTLLLIIILLIIAYLLIADERNRWRREHGRFAG